jgi:parallel beta-helix repeat protein
MELRRLAGSRRAVLAPPVAALALLGFALAVKATPSAASPNQSCAYYASPSGSDSNPGTAAAPFQTVNKLAGALAAGQTGCLTAGTFAGDVSLSRGGQPGAPIVLTSADPANPATIKGRIVTFPGGDWITFTQLYLDGVNAGALPSPTVGSDHVTFSNVDVTNEHTAICFDLINSSQWGVAHYTTIDSSRIHDCGVLPATNGDHGIYASGYNAAITNNYIYGNADRGVQLRGATNTLVQNNVIDGNGEGVIFGDLTTAGNTVTNNIVTNSKVRWNAESFWGSGPVGAGNSFQGNCVWATNGNSYYDSNGGVADAIGFTAGGNVVASPQYVNAAAGNYALQSGSPCAGKGPATTAVGVTAGAPAPAPAPTPTPTTTSGSTPTGGTTTSTAPTTTAPAPTTTPPSPTTTTTPTTTAPAPTPAPGGPAPVNTSLPTTSGVAAVGATIAATPGTWTGADSFSYWWLRCDRYGGNCNPIAGANGTSYRPTPSDRGFRIRVSVIAQNAHASTSATSAATSVVSSHH